MEHIYWLEPGHAGTDVGTEANPFASWASCITHLNTTHPDIVTAMDTVTVNVSGGLHTLADVQPLLNVVSSPTYRVTFYAPPNLRTPGVLSEAAPGIRTTSVLNGIHTGASVPFNYVFDGINWFADGTTRIIEFESLSAPTGSVSYVEVRNCVARLNIASTTTAALFNNGSNARQGIKANNVVFDGVKNTSTGVAAIYRNGGTFASNGGMVAGEFVNCTFIDCDRLLNIDGVSAAARMVNNIYRDVRAYNTDRWTADSDFGVTDATDITLDAFLDLTQSADLAGIFVSGTDRKLVGPLGYGAGPDNIALGAFVPQFCIAGNERTGETTDAGAHLFPAGGILLSSPVTFEKLATSVRLRAITDTVGGEVVFALYASGTAPALVDPGTAAAVFAEAAVLTSAFAAQSVVPQAVGIIESPAFIGLDPNTVYEARVVQGIAVPGVVAFVGPNVDPIAGVVGVALTPLNVAARYSDTQNETLAFSAVGTWPAGVTVTALGVIEGTPTLAGSYTGLVVRATNESAATADSNAFDVTVTEV